MFTYFTDIEREFKDQLKVLIPLLLDSDNLIVKEINGSKVTCRDLMEYFKVSHRVSIPGDNSVLCVIINNGLKGFFNDWIALKLSMLSLLNNKTWFGLGFYPSLIYFKIRFNICLDFFLFPGLYQNIPRGRITRAKIYAAGSSDHICSPLSFINDM